MSDRRLDSGPTIKATVHIITTIHILHRAGFHRFHVLASQYTYRWDFRYVWWALVQLQQYFTYFIVLCFSQTNQNILNIVKFTAFVHISNNTLYWNCLVRVLLDWNDKLLLLWKLSHNKQIRIYFALFKYAPVENDTL